jgi:hypothetical protein
MTRTMIVTSKHTPATTMTMMIRLLPQMRKGSRTRAGYMAKGSGESE